VQSNTIIANVKAMGATKDLENIFIRYLEQERQLSSKTVEAYKSDIGRFKRFINSRKVTLNNIDYDILKEYLGYLYKSGLSKKSVARHISSLKTFFKFLKRNDFLDNDAISLIQSPKLNRKLPDIYSEANIKSLLEIREDDFFETRNTAILEMLYASGLRISELTGLNIENVDLEEKQVRVRGKGSKERVVPFHKRCANLLEDYLCKRERKVDDSQKAFFISIRGRRISDSQVRKMLKERLQKLGLPIFLTPHGIRHSFATHMLEKGADLRTLQELLGHVDMSSTQVYTHLSRTALKKVYKRSHPRS